MVTVAADYAAINAARDIAKPWIELWGGDEWGESMRDAIGASHTSYGFTDEDCATIAQIMINNLICDEMTEFVLDYSGGLWGPGYDSEDGEKALEETQTEARESRAYWLEGGNIKSEHCQKMAKELIDQLPGWLFGE